MTLASEQVVIQSPMSFVGSTRRIWKITRVGHPALKVLLVPLAVALLLVAWTVVACWTVVFGIFLVPYRLLRRGQRRRRQDALRHRELLG